MASKSALLKHLELKEREKKSPLVRHMDSQKERGKLLSSADMKEGEDTFAYLERKKNEEKESKIRDIRYESMKDTVDYDEAAKAVKKVSFNRLPQQSAAQQFINQNDLSGRKNLAEPKNSREAFAKNIAESDLTSYRRREAEREAEQQRMEAARASADVQKDIDDINKNIDKAKKDAIVGELSLLMGKKYPHEQAKERLEWLEKELAKYEDELEFSKYAEYEKLKSAEDFAEKSGYSTTANPNDKRRPSMQSGIFTGVPGYDDWIYEYINKNPEIMAAEYMSRKTGVTNAASAMGYDLEFLQQMTEDEIGIYNYIYKTNGKERAEEYLEYIQGDLYARQREASEERYAEFAQNHPVLASAASVASNTAKGAAYLGQTASEILTGEIDPNASFNAPVYNTNAMRSAVSGMVEEKWGKAGSFAYGVGMSMADFLAASALSGGTGLSMLIMGSSAAADTTLDALDRGVDSDAALILGAAAGAIEAATEKLSIDALFKGDWEKAVKYIIKNMGIEGLEEGVSSIANTITDIMLSGDKSEWAMSVAAYMDEGFSKKDAFTQTFLDKMQEIGLDVLGGVISGGVMAGGSVGFREAGAAAAKADERYSQFETLREAVNQDVDRREFDFVKDGSEQEGIVLPTASDEQKNTDGKIVSGLDEDKAIRAKTYAETVLDKKIAEATTTAEKSGLRLGVAESDIKVAKSLGRRIGRDIVFYEDTSEAGKSQDGYIDRRHNAIYVNKAAGAKKAVSAVLGHELGHSVEGTEAYEALEQKAMETLIRNGKNPDTERDRIRELYKRANVRLATDADVDAEIVAKYIEENLLNNRAAIRELVRENPSAARRMNMALAKMVMKVAGSENLIDQKTIAASLKIYEEAIKAAEAEAEAPREAEVDETAEAAPLVAVSETEVDREQAAPAESKEPEAVKPEVKKTYTAEPAVSREETSKADEPLPSGYDDYLREITEKYDAGEMSDEEYNEAYSAVEEARETGVPFDRSSVEVEYIEGKIPEFVRKKIVEPIGNKVKFSISGVGANSADRTLLVKAHEMEAGGADSETIRRETGWFRGYDGEWRFEIDDSEMKLLLGEETSNYLTLRELIDHPKLFRAYPELQYIDVVFQSLESANATYNAQFNDISVDRDLKKNPEQLKRSLIHEIQHAIQYIEGFATGASPSYWERQLKSGFDSRRQAQKEEAARLWENFGKIREENPEFAEEMDYLRSIVPNVPRGAINWDTLEQIEEDPPEWQRYDAELDRLEEKYGTAKVFDYINLAQKISQLEMSKGRDARELYYETAGEIEARDTANRVEFNIEKRKNIRPDIDRKDVVFAENRGTSNDIVVLENGNTYVKASRKIITGESLSEQRKQITEFFNTLLGKNKSLDIHTIQGDVLTITEAETAYKARDNYRSENGKRVRMSDDEFKVKLNAETHIDELAEVSQPYNYEKDNKAHDFAKEGFVYRSAYFEDFDGQLYKLDISVGQNGTVATIYNIGKIKGSKPSSAKIIAAVGSKTLDGLLPNDSISQSDGNVNDPVQYSVSDDEENQNESKPLRDILPTQAMTRLRNAEHAFAQSMKEMFELADEEMFAAFIGDLRMVSKEFILNDTQPEDALDKIFSDYNTADGAAMEAWEYSAFDRSAKQYINQLGVLKRFSERRAATDTPEKARKVYTKEEAAELFEAQRNAHKALDKAKARALLTEEDKLAIGQLKRGERSIEQLNPAEYNVDDIRTVLEAQIAFDTADKEVKLYQKNIKAGYLSEAEDTLQNIAKWKDKKLPLAYMRETIDRNFRDIIPDKEEAESFINQYVKPVHQAEADKQRMIKHYRDQIKSLQLKETPAPGEKVSESYAVQLLGEAEDNIRMLEKMRNRQAKRDGRTLEEWKAVIELLWAENPTLDQVKIRGAVESFRQIYDELIKQMNDVLLENGYPPVRYRSGYFPHFTAGSEDSVLAKFSRVFGIRLDVNPLPTSINGLTQDFKPGKPWFSHALERTGFETAYDAVAGFEQYIGGVSDVIHHTKNIQRYRALTSQIRWLSADEGIKREHEKILNNETLDEEQREALIKKLYRKGRYRMSNLVIYLDEYTNRLANKKLRLDRTMEEWFGRKSFTVLQNLESRVAANMIGANIGSALTNFIPLNQAQAEIGGLYVMRGLWDTMQNIKNSDGLAAMSDFLVRRRGSDRLGLTDAEKFSKTTAMPMELVDNLVSEAIVRAAYLKNLKSGMSEETALEDADAIAASILADRSKGALPLIFDVKNPLTKLFTQFQVEVNNEFSVIFKDLPEKTKEEGAAMLAWMLLKYFFGAKIFNDIYEKLLGRRPAFDPIEMLNDAVGGISGYQLPNVLDIFEGDAWKVERGNPAEVITTTGRDVAESLPFFGGVIGGGRVPIQSAIPDFEIVLDALANNEWSIKHRLSALGKELAKPAAYLLPTAGGGTAKKVIETAIAGLRGGVYGVADETLDDGTVIGADYLKYPFFTDNAIETAQNFARSLMSGPSTTTGGVEWVESGFKSITASETQVYQKMIASGDSQHKSWDTIWKIKQIPKGTKPKDAEVCKIIAEAQLSYDSALALYESKVSDKHGEDIREVMASGVSFDDYLMLRAEYLKIQEGSKDPLKKTADLDKYINKHFKSESQREAIKSVFEYSASKTSVKNYKGLVDAGIGEDHAFEIASVIDALEPVGDAKSVTQVQKARAIIDTVSDDDDQAAALDVVLSDSDAKKYRAAREMGVDADSYTTFREALPAHDADGNGSYTHAEIRSAIDAISGVISPNEMILMLMSGQPLPESYTLTNAQKAVMWQLATGSKTAKNNPYSTSVGEQVIKMLDKE